MNLGWTDIAGLAAGIAESPLDHVRQHHLVTVPADWGILTPAGYVTVLSDIIVMMLVAAVLLILFVPPAIRRRKGDDEVGRHVSRGPGTMLELICQYLREEVARPLLGEHTDRFIGYIWTVFFFILTVNLLGLLPFGSLTGIFGTHIGGTATANVWVTGALAVVTLGMMVVNGLRLGGTHYLAHFNPAPKDLHWVLKIFLVPLLVLLEIAGTIFKIGALAIRLLANMIAGHILLAVLIGFVLSAGASHWLAGLSLAGLAVIPAAVAITLLEIFVAVLQAFIFTFLSALFLGQSVVFHHGHDDEHVKTPQQMA
jgi:F-type H+-transporting ATPase subunit a